MGSRTDRDGTATGATGGPATGAVRYRRGVLRAVTPSAVAERLAEIEQAACAFGVRAVARPLAQAAREALAVARTQEEAELARRLLAEAERAAPG